MCSILVQKKYNNVVIWQINGLERLLAKIEKNFKEVLFMILDL